MVSCCVLNSDILCQFIINSLYRATSFDTSKFKLQIVMHNYRITITKMSTNLISLLAIIKTKVSVLKYTVRFAIVQTTDFVWL